jgi:hypothetical protein
VCRTAALVVLPFRAHDDRRRRSRRRFDPEVRQQVRERGTELRHLVVRLVGTLANLGKREPDAEVVRSDRKDGFAANR